MESENQTKETNKNPLQVILMGLLLVVVGAFGGLFWQNLNRIDRLAQLANQNATTANKNAITALDKATRVDGSQEKTDRKVRANESQLIQLIKTSDANAGEIICIKESDDLQNKKTDKAIRDLKNKQKKFQYWLDSFTKDTANTVVINASQPTVTTQDAVKNALDQIIEEKKIASDSLAKKDKKKSRKKKTDKNIYPVDFK